MFVCFLIYLIYSLYLFGILILCSANYPNRGKVQLMWIREPTIYRTLSLKLTSCILSHLTSHGSDVSVTCHNLTCCVKMERKFSHLTTNYSNRTNEGTKQKTKSKNNRKRNIMQKRVNRMSHKSCYITSFAYETENVLHTFFIKLGSHVQCFNACLLVLLYKSGVLYISIYSNVLTLLPVNYYFWQGTEVAPKLFFS